MIDAFVCRLHRELTLLAQLHPETKDTAVREELHRALFDRFVHGDMSAMPQSYGLYSDAGNRQARRVLDAFVNATLYTRAGMSAEERTKALEPLAEYIGLPLQIT